MTKKLAVFDLDGTLLKCNASYAFGVWLYKTGQLSLFLATAFLKDYLLHFLFRSPLRHLHEKSFIRFKRHFTNERLSSLADQFVELEWKNLIYIPALKKLEEAKGCNHFTLILSSSPDFLVAPFAKRLEVDKWRATLYRFKKRRGPHVIDGERKRRLLLSFMRLHKIPKIDTRAYSDSDLDLPLLLEAGEAVGVNPNKKLKQMCLINQWDII